MRQAVTLHRYLGPMCGAWIATGRRIPGCWHESCRQIAIELVASRYANGSG